MAYDLVKITEGLDRVQSEFRPYRLRADGDQFLITVGTLAGLVGCTVDGLLELNDFTDGPIEKGKSRRPAPIEAVRTWISRVGQYFSGAFGDAEIDEVIEAVKTGSRPTGTGIAAAGTTQMPADAPAVASAAAPAATLPARSAASTSAASTAPDRSAPQTDEEKRIVDATLLWKNSAALRAEFRHNVAAYLAYTDAAAAGRVKSYGPGARTGTAPQGAAARPSPAPERDTGQVALRDQLLWNGNAALRAEFGGRQELFIAFQRGARAGRIKGYAAL